MPASADNYNKIRTYQENAASLSKQASGVAGTAGTLGDMVMKAVRDDRATRGVSKLATDVGNVMGQMVSDPEGIRNRTRGIVDPTSVNALTSGARAQNLRTLGTISTQQAANQGDIDEVIQSGANQLKARASQLMAEAEQEAAKAKALEDEWGRAFQEQKFSADESYRQQQLAIDWFNANNKGGAGGVFDLIEKYNEFEPSDTLKKDANRASDFLSAASRIQAASDSDLQRAAKIAGGIGGNGIASLVGFGANLASSPAQQQLAKDLDLIKNIKRLELTGAAFSATERPEYSFLVGADYISTIKNPKLTKDAVAKLTPYYEEAYRMGQNPYAAQRDALISASGGTVAGGRNPSTTPQTQNYSSVIDKYLPPKK